MQEYEAEKGSVTVPRPHSQEETELAATEDANFKPLILPVKL